MNNPSEGTAARASDHAAPVAPRRVLLAMLVYNGETFVPRAIESMARLQGLPGEIGPKGKLRAHIVDALVLDDASPAPGWSEALAEQCQQLDVGYYRTPRNLGIPRNMNLGLLRGEAGGYDYVAILNSDVIFPANMVEVLVAAAESRPGIASVTAWTNNASIFSLPNDNPDRWLADVNTVDSISTTLHAEFGAEAIDIPVGVGFCLLISARAISEVGLFDPVFGRGYCEEVDWCCRAVAAGFTHALAPGAFVYHIGSATNRVAGLLAPGEHTVHTNEAIIDQRHPDYRNRVATWEATIGFVPTVDRGIRALVQSAAAEHGYLVDATWLRRQPLDPTDRRVRISINPDGPNPLVEAVADGWRCEIPIGAEGILAGISGFVGCAPNEVRLLDSGSIATTLSADAARAGVPVQSLRRYPERV
jgi:GT2 family glycosyltransferase